MVPPDGSKTEKVQTNSVTREGRGNSVLGSKGSIFGVFHAPGNHYINAERYCQHYKSFAKPSRTQTSRNADEGGLISSRQRAPAYGQSDARTDRKVWVESDRALSVQPQSHTQWFPHVPLSEETPRRDEVCEVQEEVNAYLCNADGIAGMTTGFRSSSCGRGKSSSTRGWLHPNDISKNVNKCNFLWKKNWGPYFQVSLVH